MLSAQRYVAYTSDIGESFRPVAHPNWVRAAYGVSWAYLIGDVSHEGYKAYCSNQRILHPELPREASEQRYNDATKPLPEQVGDVGDTKPGVVPAINDYRTVMAQRAIFQATASMGEFPLLSPSSYLFSTMLTQTSSPRLHNPLHRTILWQSLEGCQERQNPNMGSNRTWSGCRPCTSVSVRPPRGDSSGILISSRVQDHRRPGSYWGRTCYWTRATTRTEAEGRLQGERVVSGRRNMSTYVLCTQHDGTGELGVQGSSRLSRFTNLGNCLEELSDQPRRVSD